MSIHGQQVWNFYGEAEKGIVVTGIMKGEVSGGSSGSVKIFRDGKFYQEVFSGPGGKYEADLPFDSDYELEFSIPGCVTKRIKVETNLPAESHDQTVEPLAFNMSLPKATNGPLDEAYETPVSRLYFNNAVGDFDRDMVAEEAFRNTLRAKQAEHKRWLEEQKAKEEAEKEKKRQEELDKKKAEDAERLAAEAAARKKADEEAAAAAKKKAEEDAKKAAELAAAKKAQEEALKKAQEEEFLRKQKEEELRKQQELRNRQIADSLYKENERIKQEKILAAQEAERKRKEAEDKALQDKLDAQKAAALAALRQKEVADSIFQENEKVRLAKIAEDKEAERLRKENEALEKSLQDKLKAEQAALAEQLKKAAADSLYKENERIRLAKIAAEKDEAERKRLEAEEKAMQDKMNAEQAALAELRRKFVEDSLFEENERLRLAKEQEAAAAEQQRFDEENAAYASNSNTAPPSGGGAGKSVFYQVDLPDYEKSRDYGAADRASNWERIKRERREAYLAKIERKKAESAKVKVKDTKKQRDFLEKQRLIQERRLLAAERMKQKEQEAEAIRQARLKESLDKKIVILVAYSSASTQNPNAKFYGYVNFGDGKGPLELTESEYKEMTSRFNGIYNKP